MNVWVVFRDDAFMSVHENYASANTAVEKHSMIRGILGLKPIYSLSLVKLRR